VVTEGPALDVSDAYLRTLRSLFANAEAPHRVFRASELQRYLIERWTVVDAGPDGAFHGPTVWLASSSSRELLSLPKMLALVVLGGSPPQGWTLTPPDSFPELTFLDRSRVLATIDHAASMWSLDTGMLHPGLDEILETASHVIGGYRLAQHHAHADRARVWGIIEHVLQHVAEFEPDPTHWDTVADLGQAMRIIGDSLMGLPPAEEGALAAEIGVYQQLAERAHELLFRADGDEPAGSRGYLDLIDGDLVSWGIVAERLFDRQREEPTLQLVLSRFDLRARRIGDTDVSGLAVHPLDYDVDKDKELSTKGRAHVGAYSLRREIRRAEQMLAVLAHQSGRTPRAPLHKLPLPQVDSEWLSLKEGKAKNLTELGLT
jgi:hypothetical protein